MHKQLRNAIVLAAALAAGCSPASAPPTGSTPESRVVAYLEESIESGRMVEVSGLVNEVFTSPEEREAVNRLYDTFFRIPMFLVQFAEGTGELPSLDEIAEQFAFESAATADVILSLMESDPRIPRFFERDAQGELVALEIQPILAHPQFGQQIERSIAGWEGLSMPAFTTETFDGQRFASTQLDGSPYLVYVWFSNCPPCLETSPLLVELDRKYRDRGFQIVALNADRYLELPYDDATRNDYAEAVGMDFRLAHLSAATHDAFGGVSIFPTMFVVDGSGAIVRHFVNFQERDVLEAAVEAALPDEG
jgi:thiol-disulfide isomerase/thioredoxin